MRKLALQSRGAWTIRPHQIPNDATMPQRQSIVGLQSMENNTIAWYWIAISHEEFDPTQACSFLTAISPRVRLIRRNKGFESMESEIPTPRASLNCVDNIEHVTTTNSQPRSLRICRMHKTCQHAVERHEACRTTIRFEYLIRNRYQQLVDPMQLTLIQGAKCLDDLQSNRFPPTSKACELLEIGKT